MYKNNRFIAAGDNEFYRYGKKAAELLKSHKNLVKGYYSLPVDGGEQLYARNKHRKIWRIYGLSWKHIPCKQSRVRLRKSRIEKRRGVPCNDRRYDLGHGKEKPGKSC